MNDNQYPNQQGYPQQGYPQQQYQGQLQQWQNQQYQGQQVPPQQQQWQGQQVPPQQQWQGQWQQQPQQQWAQTPPPSSSGSSVGLVIGLVIGGILLIVILLGLIIAPALIKYMNKAEQAQQVMQQQSQQTQTTTGSSSHSDDVTFSDDYFAANNWVGVNDTALIIPESDGTFVWYRDKNDKDGDYYSGEYKLYIGDDAVEYLTTESEVKDSVTEDDIKELEAPEYGATRDNFVCLVLTNNKEVYYGEEHTYEGDDRVTTTLYGYFVNDKQGYKLTLVKFDNPYEFNLSPEEK